MSWTKTHNYVRNALQIVGEAGANKILDKKELYNIKAKLGDPPNLCYPIYFITVENEDDDEKLVYIGKTSSKSSRFKSGHTALTKLLSPKYNGLNKQIYLSTVVFLTDEKDYLPLEWVQPIDTAHKLLMQIESRLISHFKPELNTREKNTKASFLYTQIHFQNSSERSSFLNDKFIQI